MDQNCVESPKCAIQVESRERRVEVGRFIKLNPIHFICYYESFPTWLLLFDAFVCLSITMCGVENLESFESKCVSSSSCSLQFVRWMMNQIGLEKFRFGLTCLQETPSNALVLLSGSISFVTTVLKEQHVTKGVFIVDNHFSGRLRHGRPTGDYEGTGVNWQRLQDKTFGGPTDFVTLGGTMGFTCKPSGSELRRSIRDIIGSKIQPQRLTRTEVVSVCTPPNTLVGERMFYFVEDVVRCNLLWLPVFHKTHFFPSGWGKRCLSSAELFSAYGYPRQTHMQLENWVLDYVPYQILYSLFRSAVSFINHERSGQGSVIVKSVVSDGSRDQDSQSTTRFNQDTQSVESFLPRLGKWLSHVWTGTTITSQSAAKSDDAGIPVHLWDARVNLVCDKAALLLPLLRILCLRWSRRNLVRGFRTYLAESYGSNWLNVLYDCRRRKGCSLALQREGGESTDNEEIGLQLTERKLLNDVRVGREVIVNFADCNWWEWSSGSSLVFWRWNEEDRDIARDGMAPFIQSALPNWKQSGPKKIKEPKLSLTVKKLKTIIDRNYLSPGKVVSWTDFFDVPKGEDDIRLVYNGTSCGLNPALWAPNFWLPFPRSATRLLDYNSYSGDMDLGEMFHNFPLHKTLQEYSGIDLSPFHKELKLDKTISVNYRWTRTWMGARSSPYSSVRYYYVAEEFVRGNHLDTDNEMRWDIIILNLPGDKNYDPTKPRVQKWNNVRVCIAGDIITFVDDGRVTGCDLEHAWAILRQVNSRFQYLGIQVALRKVHEPRQNPGPWAGALFETTKDTITRSVTLDKWNKGKRIVEEVWSLLDVEGWADRLIDYKQLEIARGFLCHLSMTFEILVPYLKGFHLTLSSHLNKRDKEGWKHTDKAWKSYLDYQLDEGTLTHEEVERLMTGNPYSPIPPKTILPVKQLKDDVFALREFLAGSEPPKIQERSKQVRIVRYGFGDASGSGFGSTIETKEGLKYRIGVWGSDDDNESSNFKELENVVSTIEEEAACGNLKESVLFFFTDNSTVEAALFKGNSTSRKLLLLVLRFRKVQFLYGAHIIISHVSGKRMIDQGTDGVSRGNLHEGVGTGMEMIGYIPLHLSALERNPLLVNWLKSWMGQDAEFLEPKDWFTRGHDHDGGSKDRLGMWRVKIRPGLLIWGPPPAAAEVALEEMRKALIKRQKSTHIFICPRLLTTEWMKQLHKTADLIISIPAGSEPTAWPLNMHEPLTIGFVFPLLPCNPWQRKSTPQMFYVERQLSKLFKGEGVAPGDFLCKFLAKQRQLSNMPELLKLRNKVEPNLELAKDKLLMVCIRRIILDSFWSRATSTVLGNRDRAKAALRLSESVGLKGPFEHTTTLPAYDHCGYEVAIQMVLDSTNPGRYSSDHKQWDTIRKLRTVYSSQAKASPQANSTSLAFSDERTWEGPTISHRQVLVLLVFQIFCGMQA